jgi:lipoprotein-anchoring transpeptidase ErfK/SrfK
MPAVSVHTICNMLHRAVILTAFVALACAAAPGATRVPAIAPGVIVSGVYVGDLTSEPARDQLAREFARPLRVVYGDQHWVAYPQQLGGGATIDRAVAKALDAPAGADIAMDVRWSRKKVNGFVAAVARRIDKAPLDATLQSVGSSGPVITSEQDGIAVDQTDLRRKIERKLRQSLRTRVVVTTRPVTASRTRADFGKVIWVDRGSNSLRLYDGEQLVRQLGVATGQSKYPTPSGMYSIVTMQRDPWWIPPDSAWAEGEKPVPPGPGNPLGTRWMGISAPGVGLHGTPDAASIGYSASHGCIRMRIPDAEWLFNNVYVGTPVYIT